MKNKIWPLSIAIMAFIIESFLVKFWLLEKLMNFIFLDPYYYQSLTWRNLSLPLGIIISFFLVCIIFGSLIKTFKDYKQGMGVGFMCGIFWGLFLGIPGGIFFGFAINGYTGLSVLVYSLLGTSVYGVLRGIKEELFPQEDKL